MSLGVRGALGLAGPPLDAAYGGICASTRQEGGVVSTSMPSVRAADMRPALFTPFTVATKESPCSSVKPRILAT